MRSNKGCLFAAPLIGGLVVLMMLPMLFWNEGRAINTYRSLVEGAGAVLSVASDAVDGSNEGKLVHITGRAITDKPVRDSIFAITEDKILRLKRTVEMYQWHEKSESTRSSSESSTKYTYYKDWSDEPIHSSSFHQDGYDNPPLPYTGEVFNAETVTVGAFVLPLNMVSEMDDFQQIRVDKAPELSRPVKVVSSGYFYLGENETSPQIGDVKISFAVIRPGDVSVVAQQTGNSFRPHPTSYYPVELFQSGAHSAQAMFDTAQTENTFMTWMLRCMGFMGIFIGLMMIFKPLTSLLDYIPILGDMANFGIGVFAFGLAFGTAFVIISLGWIFYRPLLGCTLLIVGAAGFAGTAFAVQKLQQKPE
ncbi:TMEM43 family protein [Anaerolineales bacterium HSG25]|nr:TMEM43 family protein [Anaerolineales bacterium HSG25]